MKFLTVSKILFCGFFILYSFFAYYFAYVLEIYHNDAISRTALAFFTVFGRDPHLAAIGFVWQPLPSLAQIPLLIILRPLGLMMLAGPLVTAFCGAFSVGVVYKIGTILLPKEKRFLSIMIALLFGINPLILLYSAIGTSEMLFIICLLLCSYYLIRYFYRHDQAGLLMASIAIAASFWSRYEALPALLGLSGMILLFLLFHKSSLKKYESTFLQFGLPFLYSVLMWILANWLIMKDPFYFMNSPYSNGSFTTNFKNNPTLLENSYHHFLNSLNYILTRVVFLSPAVLLAPLIGTIFFVKLKNRINELLLLSFLTFPFLSILLFHAYQLYKGESFGWLRFVIYAIPMGALISFYFVRQNAAAGLLAVFLMVTGVYSSLYAINKPTLGREEQSFAKKLSNPQAEVDFSRSYLDQKQVAQLMDTLPGMILVDTDKGFAIPLFAKDPNRYIITSDLDYIKVVTHYTEYAHWIIVPQPVSDDRGQNKIYEFNPGIWEGNAPEIVFFKQIEGWRIFKVNSVIKES